jgi:hypothetical protein
MLQGWSRSCLIAFVMLLGGLPATAGQTAHAAQLGRRTVDLTAIILTTADLEDAGLEGFGLWAASPLVLADDVNTISNAQQLDADEVEEILDDAGYSGSYVHNQHLPSDADNPGGLPLVRVLTRAYAFDDADGAADAYEIIADESETGFDDEPGRVRLGDEAELTELEFEADGTFGVPYLQLELEILFDRLVLEVSLNHFEVDGEIESFSRDDTDTIEALGERLIERAEAALDGETPNLLPQMITLDIDNGIAPYLTYYVLDGDPIRSVWETDESFADRVDGDADLGIVTLLRQEQILVGASNDTGAIRFYNLTMQFDRERDAEDYMDDALERIQGPSGELELVELDVPQLGDQSIALGRGPGSDRDAWSVNQILVRVGETVSWLWIQQDNAGADNPVTSEEILTELGEAQAECLEAGECDGRLSMSDDLTDLLNEA